MSSKLQQRVREVFNVCLQTKSTVQRAEVIERECSGDLELKAAVEKLLDAHDVDASYLERPLDRLVANQAAGQLAATVATTNLATAEVTQIGPYKIREQIGEGGMGVVYAAEQKTPIRRKVALKIIKAGMDTGQVIARFEAERQTLAMMDHPNIAKVIDAGATETGRPYFVMELIVGLSITDYCDQARMTTRQRLELFVEVCRAVQHAHQKGIIHRDLKPSNVMITEIDAKPVAKVIDFGLAKATGEQLTEQTIYTNVSQMLGTPLYMSPEQAGLSGLDVDTRSDVYSLGVLLYELLSGCTPFDREQMRGKGYEEIRRIIREVEPPRPSNRVDTLKASESSTISERRSVDSRRLHQTVTGELDWIVMKALEKDRNRRYETASSLAADIERYLNDEPVQAFPPSNVYQFRKFARRNSVLLGTGAMVAAALMIGVGLASLQAIRAVKAEKDAVVERDRAIDAEQLAKDEATRAEKAEQLAKEEAEKARTETAISAAVSAFLNDDLLAQANPENQPNPNVTLRTVIDQAAKKIDTQFADQPLVEATIRHTLAKTYAALGVSKEAQQHADRALKLCTQLLGAENKYTIESARIAAQILAQLGDLKAAREELDALLTRASRALGPEDLETLSVMNSLANVLRDQGDYSAAEKLYLKTLEIGRHTLGDEHPSTLSVMNNLANVLRDKGDYAQAENLYLQILEIQRRTLGDEHPITLTSMGNLANVLSDQGDYSAAEKLNRQTLEIRQRTLGDEHLNTLVSMNSLASVLWSKADYPSAEKLSLDTLEIGRRTLGDEHPYTLTSMLTLAGVYQGQARYDEAEKLYLQTLEIYRRILSEDHPKTLAAMNNLALVYQEQARFDESEKLHLQTLEIRRGTLGEEHPSTLESMNNLAIVYRSKARFDEAEDLLLQTLEIQRRALGKEHPSTLNSMGSLANVYSAQARYDEAQKLQLQTLAIKRRTLGEEHPSTLDSMNNLAVVYYYQARYDEAEKLYLQTFEIRRRVLGDEHPRTLSCVESLALVYRVQARYNDEEAHYLQTLESYRRKFGEEHPSTLTIKNNLGAFYGSGAWQLATSADPKARDPKKGIIFARKTVELLPNEADGWQVLGWSHYRLGHWQETIEAEMKSIELTKNVGDPWQWLFLAMAHWQLGEKEIAHEYYARSAASEEHSKHEEVLRFFAEAEELMGLSGEDRAATASEYDANRIKAEGLTGESDQP
ncbi:MAG: serine/threonine protein kinase [Pirellulaceae bacterium]|jgi:serine/threonine protein kinase